jgi:hypothetical protein
LTNGDAGLLDLAVGALTQENDFRVGRSLSDQAGGPDPIPVRQADIEDDEIGL